MNNMITPGGVAVTKRKSTQLPGPAYKVTCEPAPDWEKRLPTALAFLIRIAEEEDRRIASLEGLGLS
jgi:hypothetical protein